MLLAKTYYPNLHLLYISKELNSQQGRTQTSNQKSNSFGSVEDHAIPSEVGTFFPEIVLLAVPCDKKSIYSDVIETNHSLKLTSEALGDIPIPSILKIKLYANKKPGKIDLKIQTQTHEHHFYLDKDYLSTLFPKLIWLRLAAMNVFAEETDQPKDQIEGRALKSIQFFQKQWEKVKIKAKPGELHVVSEDNKSVTKIDSLKEVWTRMELVQNQAYLVIKAWVGFRKFSLGIRVDGQLNSWMKVFSSLIQA